MLPENDFYEASLRDMHQELREHPISRGYLSCQDVRFDGAELLPEDVIELPTAAVSGLEFAHLFSVFNGSRVHQQAEPNPRFDEAPPGVYFTIVNTHLIQNQHKNRFGLYQEQEIEGEAIYLDSLHVDHYFLNEHTTPARLATIAFGLCAITAQLASMRAITLVAAGGVGFQTGHIGYKVWPKLGFDADLLPGEITGEPHLAGCSTVQDVLDRDPLWWAVRGSQRLMTFDLEEGSASWRRLLGYLSEKVTSWRCP